MTKLTAALMAGSLTLATLAGCGTQTTAPTMGGFGTGQVEASKATLARRVIVGFAKAPTKAQVAQMEEKLGLKMVKSMPKVAMGVFEVKGNAKQAISAIKAAPGVQFVESELLPEREPFKAVPVKPRLRQGASKADPMRLDQWYLETMGVDKVWASGRNLKTVRVAVVDTGVDLKHPDLQGVLLDGYNAEAPGKPPQDGYGHGTMCAGLVAAVANNGQGIAGVAPNAKIVPVKVGNSASSVVEAMMWAADNADMITMSLSFKPNMSEYPSAVESTKRAAQYVMNKNVPMACSMGNTGTSSKNVPSYFAGNEVPGLIAVGATDNQDRVTSFSTYGDWTSVSAPGRNIITTAMGGGYKAVDGTSFSTPLTAGVMALMLGAGAPSDPAAIKAKLQKTAVDIEKPGYDDKAGAGRVDAARAVLE